MKRSEKDARREADIYFISPRAFFFLKESTRVRNPPHSVSMAWQHLLHFLRRATIIGWKRDCRTDH